MTDFRGKTSIFSHPVYLFLRKFSLQDSRGGSVKEDGYFVNVRIINDSQISSLFDEYVVAVEHQLRGWM
ncbi:hypothetical protein [Escherichia coli]|uniref:hypothetical protein n=1 Tax=Escherichia coli TaxID=562 RepID=UPI00067F4752|nr:hypothetical protein [Escherichia coli]